MADPSELNLWTSQWRDVCLRRARAGYRERAVAYDCLKDKTTDYALSLKMARDVFAQVLAVWEASPVDLRPTPEKAGGVALARTYLHASRVDALIAVMEGECDGLAVTRETAEAILHYLDGNAPPAGVGGTDGR